MKLSKKSRRVMRNGIQEAQSLIDQLEQDWFLSDKQHGRLEELYAILCRIGMRLERKRERRGSERGVQEAGRERDSFLE